MKKVILIVALFFHFIFHDLSAQSFTGFSFDRFDSTNIVNIKGVNEDNSNYYVWDDYNVTVVNKLSGATENIYHSSETIIDAFIDSSGNFGFINKHKLFKLQTGMWIQENIPSDSLPINCMVDSSGAIFIALKGDSLCIFDTGIWTQLAINFSNNNEYLLKVLPGYHHECLIMSHAPSNYRVIYNLTANGLTPIHWIITTNEANVEFDSNGTCWHRELNIIKKSALNGIITYLTVPSSGYISNFRLSNQDGKLWIQKYYTNGMDSVFYFNGITWEIAYSNNQNFSLFKTRGNALLIKNNAINKNITYNNIYSYLRVLDTTSITNSFLLTLPLITGSVNCINTWQEYDLNGETEFLIGTNNGIYLRKREWSNMSLNYIHIDSTNSSLPTNHIHDFARKDFGTIINYDTIYIATDIGLLKVGIYNDSLFVYQMINHQNSNLPSDTLTKLTFSENSNNQELWVGTKSSGLAKISSNGFITVFDTVNSLLPSNSIKDISISEDIICVTTDQGFMTIIDSIQSEFTMLNSGLLTHNLNSVNVYRSYYSPSSNILKYELIVNTNGYGFAIVDTNQIWHYYNSQNQNFMCDSAYFYDKLNLFGSKVLFTNCGVMYIYGESSTISNNYFYNFSDLESSNASDINSSKINCISVGFRAGALMSNGILNMVDCFGSTSETTIFNNQLEAWLLDNYLQIKSGLIGAYTFELLDINGKRIYTEPINLNRNMNIKIPSISEGIYLVRFFNSSENHSIKVSYSK